MINDLDMQSWAYLLNPTFQFVNTAGKPLTEGYIEVYIAGTRDKYYCASDFDGTLHPFQIPLDSLGANIVLADPNQAYDVYVYNRFGSLIMSRYNVSPGNTGSGGVSMTTVTSQDNTVNITHSGNNYDLSIQDTIDRIDNLESQYGNLGASTDYAVSYGYGDGGEFVLTDKASTGINYLNDMSGWRLKPGHVYQLNYNAKFTCDEQTNKLVDGKFYLDGNMSFSQDWNFNLDDSYDYTQAFNGSTIIVVPSTLQYYDLKLKYTFNSIVNCQVDLENISIVDITSTTNMGGGAVYHEGDGININNNYISVDMDYINEHLDIDASSILSSAYNYTDARVTQASGDIINIIAEATGNLPIPEQVQSDWEQTASGEPDYIKNKPNLDIYATHDEVTSLVSSVSSVLQNEIENIDLSSYATHDEVNTAITNASGDIINYVDNSIDNVTTVIESVSGDLQEQINNIPAQVQSDWDEDDVDSPAYIDNKPDLSIYATETQLETVSGNIVAMIPDPQVQSDWNQTDDTQVDYIKNKPSIPSIEGLATVAEVSSVSSVLQNEIDNIPEQVNADWESNSGKSEILNKPDLSIYATINQLSEVSGDIISQIPDAQVQSDWNQSDDTQVDYIKNKPDLSIYATHDEVVNAVSGASGNIINYVNEQIGEIPAQVQSDWAEDDSEDLAYIKNKPTERQLIPGDNISITASGNNFVISAEGEVSLEDLATVSGNIIAQIPDAQVQSDWDESDDTQPSYIQNKPDLSNYATINDVNAITALIPEAQVQSDWTEDDTSDPSYILNKPNELELVAGNNIEIEVSGTNIVISSTASAVTGLDLMYGKFTSNNVSTTATMAKSKGNINVSNGKIQLEQGKSYHITVRGYYQQTSSVNGYTPISYVEYITSNLINIDIDRSRTDAQYFELSYDLYNLNSNTDYQVAFSGCAGLVKDLIVEIHSLGGAGTGSASGSSAIEYDAGYGINIANQVISVDSSIIPDISPLATKVELANVSGTIVGMIPDTSNLATKAEVQAASANIVGQIPDVSSFATTSELTSACNYVISIIPELPESSNLIAGNNITITASGNDYVISSTASGGGSGTTYTAGNGLTLDGNEFSIDTSVVATQSDLSAVEAEIPNAVSGASGIKVEDDVVSLADPLFIEAGRGIEFTQPDGDTIVINSTIDVSSYATKAEVTAATGDLQSQINNLPSQVQSDWTESDDSDPSYILNKPEEINLVGGDNITITVSGSSAIINGQAGGGGTSYSEGFGIDINNNTISVDTSIVALASAIPAPVSGASGVKVEDDVISLDDPIFVVAGQGISISASGDDIVISCTVTGGGAGTTYTAGNGIDITNNAISVDNTVALKTDIPDTTNLATKTEVQAVSAAIPQTSNLIPGDNITITASGSDWVINSTGGATYTAGDYINITNNVISVDTSDVVDIVAGTNVTIEVSGSSAVINATPTLASLNTAGISDIQVVNSLPASPDSHTLYLIPEA